MDLHVLIAQLDSHHTEKQLREGLISLCQDHLPFSLSELEELSAPMIRLFLTSRSGFDVSKAMLTYAILQRLFSVEGNPSRAFELQSVLRDFSTAIAKYADRKGIELDSSLLTAA